MSNDQLASLVKASEGVLRSKTSTLTTLLWIVGIVGGLVAITLATTLLAMSKGATAWLLLFPASLLLLFLAVVGTILWIYVHQVKKGDTTPLRSEEYALTMRQLELDQEKGTRRSPRTSRSTAEVLDPLPPKRSIEKLTMHEEEPKQASEAVQS